MSDGLDLGIIAALLTTKNGGSEASRDHSIAAEGSENRRYSGSARCPQPSEKKATPHSLTNPARSVADTVITFGKAQEQQALEDMEKLDGKFKLTGGSKVQYFLGVEVICDRENGKI
ncbi:hypothetical protein B0J18DRAFT_494157 [Chaetomium sp. MPI-SDFR-AT-0129]|nr:hypothetical protein B0J18DRAFT_494157 [Chaetomium sp. MPI-SDFR-AT-0129]